MSEVWLPEGLPHHGYPQSLLRCSECVRKWNSAPRDETTAQNAAVRFPLEHLKTHLAGSHRQGALSSANSLLESYCMCLQELKCTNIQRKWTDNPELDALDRETGYLKLGRWLDFTKLAPGSLPGVVSNSIPQPPPVHNQAVSIQAPRVACNSVQPYPMLAEQAAARKLASGTALNGFKQPSMMTNQEAVAPVSAALARTWDSKFQGSPAHTMNGVPPARTQRRQAAVAPTEGPSTAVQQTSMPSSQLYAAVAVSSLATPSAYSPFKQRLQQLHQAAATSPAVSLSTTPSPTVASHIPQQSPIVGHYDLVANPAAVTLERTFACKVCTQAMPGVNFPQMIRADLEKHGREVHRLRDEEISSLFPHAGYKCQLCIAMFSPAVISSLPCMDQEDLQNHGLQFHRLTQGELTRYTASSVRAVLSASGVGVASANNILNHSTAITFSPELAGYALSGAPTAAKPAQGAVQPPVVQGIPITPQNSAALFEAIVAPKDAHAPKPKPTSKAKPAPKPRGRKPKTALAEIATDDTEVKVPAKRKRAKKPSKGYTCHLCTADNRWKKQTPMDFNGLMEHGLQHHAIPQSQIETFFTAAAGALISVHQNNVNKDTVQSMLAEPDTAQVISGVVSKTTLTAPQGAAAVTPRTAQGSFNVASPQAPNSPLSSLQNQATQKGSTQNSVGNNSIANNGLSQSTISPRPSQYSPSQNGVGLGLLSGGTIRCASIGSLTLPTSNCSTMPPTNTFLQSGTIPAATPIVCKSPYQTLLAASATPARVEAAAEAVDEGDIQWLKDIFGDDLLTNDASDQSASPGSSDKQSQESVAELKATPDSEAARPTGKESTSDLGADFEAEFDASWNAQHGAEGKSQKQIDDIANAASDGALHAVKLAEAIPETPVPNIQAAQITEQPAVGEEMEMSYDFSSESRAEPRFDDDDDDDDSDEELIDLLTKFLREPEKDLSQAKYVASSSEFTAESSFVRMPKNNKSPLDNFGKLWFRGLDPTVLLPQEMVQELGLGDLPSNRKDLACLYANDEDGELGVVAADGVTETKWLNIQEWHQFKDAHLEDYALLPDHELNMAGSYGQSVDEFMNHDFLGLGNMNMGMKHGRGDDEDIWGDNLVDKRARLFY